MNVAFIIERRGCYQLFSPVIEEGLRRGWTIECWHDLTQPTDGRKSYQFPALAAAPAFRHGRPLIKGYRGPNELARWWVSAGVDAVVALGSPPTGAALPADRRPPAWIVLQRAIDTFHNSGPGGLLACNRVGVYSPWWVDRAAQYFQDQGLVFNGREFHRQFSERATTVGYPALDGAMLVDPDQIRRRWDIPPNQPVVVLLPFAGAINPFSFWAQRIFLQLNPVKQLGRILWHRRFQYLSPVIRQEHDARVVQALRRFCDRNGAFLIAKSRYKTPIPGYLRQAADLCLYDEGEYPSTLVEILRIASLSVGFCSYGVLESIGLGVPHLCLALSAREYYDELSAVDRQVGAGLLNRFRLFFGCEEGGLFQFHGATTAVSIPEAIRRLPQWTWDAFQMNPEAQADYVRTYLGVAPGRSAPRVAQLVESSVTDASGALPALVR